MIDSFSFIATVICVTVFMLCACALILFVTYAIVCGVVMVAQHVWGYTMCRWGWRYLPAWAISATQRRMTTFDKVLCAVFAYLALRWLTNP